MATNRIGGLNVVLTATTGAFNSSMRKSALSVKKFGVGVASIAKGVAKFGAALVAAAVIGLAVFVKGMLASIDTTAKLSSELGISTEALSAYRLQAGLTGTSLDAVTNSIQKMQKNLGDAGSGIGTAVQGLNQLGLKLEDIQALSPEKQFETIADSLSKIDDVSRRASAGAAIFGGKYKKIASLIDQGSEGFRKAREQTERFGTALSALDAKKVEQANDAMLLVREAFNGFIKQITVKLAPILTVIANRISDAAARSQDFGSTMDSVINFAISGVVFLVKAWSGLKIAINLVRIALDEIGIAGNKAVNGVTKAFQFLAAIGSAVWEKMKVAALSVGDFINEMLGEIQLGFARFVKGVGALIGTLLEQGAKAAHNIKGMKGVGDDLAAAAGAVRQATGGVVANVKNEIKEAIKGTAELEARAIEANRVLGALLTGTGPSMSGSGEAVKRIELLERDKAAAAAAIRTEMETIANSDSLAAEFRFDVSKVKQSAVLAAAAAEERLAVTKTSEEIRQALILSQQEEFNAKLVANEKSTMDKNMMLWQSGLRGRLKITSSILGQLGSLMQSKSRKAFEVGKAAAISEAVINTSLAGIKAYQAMVGIPVVGPALAVAAAGAAVAAGVVQVQSIKSTSFGGGSVSSGGGGGGVSAAAAAAPEGVEASGQVSSGENLEIVIDDSSGGMIDGRRLVQMINEAQSDGALITSVRLA